MKSEIQNPKSKIKCGGLILCGGKSARMGLSKATLPFGPELMLQRVVRLVALEASPVAVVAAAGQELPPLPADVIVARDQRAGRGPLEGLLAGLTALAAHCVAAYATSCDVPLLAPAFVREMIGRLDDFDIVVPVEGQFHHPLAAVYRTSLAATIERLLAADQLRTASLFERVATRRVSVSELAVADPGLATLRNLNEPRDYLAALAEEGLAVDPHVARALETRHSEP